MTEAAADNFELGQLLRSAEPGDFDEIRALFHAGVGEGHVRENDTGADIEDLEAGYFSDEGPALPSPYVVADADMYGSYTGNPLGGLFACIVFLLHIGGRIVPSSPGGSFLARDTFKIWQWQTPFIPFTLQGGATWMV